MWQGCEIAELPSEEDTALQEVIKEKQDKEKFAVAWIQNPNDVYKAALSVEPYNSYRASWIAEKWITDPYVLTHRAKLITDTGQLLPTKVNIVHLALEIATHKHESNETKLKALRFISDVQGWTGPGVNANIITNNNVSTQNRVMQVPMEMGEATWEQMAIRQQKLLTATNDTKNE